MTTLLLLSLALPALAGWTPPDESCADPASAQAGDWDISKPHGATHEVILDLREGTWLNVTVHGGTVIFDLLGDLWSVPVAGGEASRLTSGPAWDIEPAFSPDGSQVAYTSDADGNEQIWLMNVDGSGARRLTDEQEARFTDPVWDPKGSWIFARRRTVDTRSIGVTEIWQVHLDGGKGFALTSKDADPHAGEVTTDGTHLWFSTRNGRFEYNHDPVGGLWHISRLDRDTGEIRTVVDGSGSAVRPVLSPDGNTIAFVSRDRTKTLLELLDVQTGRRRVLADWLSHDEMEGFALHGVYPAMGWVGPGTTTPGAAGLVLWAEGRLWRVGLDGTRAEIPFHVQGAWTLHDVPRSARTVPDEVVARVIRWPRQHPDGRIVFSAMGSLWTRQPDGSVERLSAGTGYAPAWSPDGKTLAWVSWTDCPTAPEPDDPCGGALHLTRGKKTETLPIRGQLVNPAWGEGGDQLVVLRGVGGGNSPDLGAEPWYEVVLLERGKKGWTSRVVTSLDSPGTARAPRLFLHDDRVWFTRDRATKDREPADTALVSVALDGTDERTHLVLPGASEVVPSPDFRRVAWKAGHQVHVGALPLWAKEVPVADGALPSRQLTEVVGDWLDWTPDNAALSWMEGNQLNTLPVDRLSEPDTDDDLLEPPQKPEPTRLTIDLRLPRARPEGTVAYTHATVLTMEDDRPVVEDATLVVERDRIVSVEPKGAVPAGASVVDLTGKTVIPGLVDVHAHLHYTAGDVLPAQEWRYLTNLDYGVTTTLDPSAFTDLVFTQSERVEAGLEKGPRIYSTGFILYGALSSEGAPTPDLEAARNHVRRLVDVGATAVKVYQQSRREQRQWYVAACNEQGVLCVAEGGGDLQMDLNMMVDGMHADEHALPITPLWADVKGLFAGSHTADTWGTAYTPTLLVAYGGLMGENWYFQHANPLDDPRLLRHLPRRQLDARAWRPTILAQDGDWSFRQTAREAAAMSRLGVLVTLGGHGQLQGLGPHWEMWSLAGPGAMTPEEALRAATIQGARYMGLDGDLGSIAAGKLADLVVLDADPRQDIHNSTKIDFVVKNGEVWR